MTFARDRKDKLDAIVGNLETDRAFGGFTRGIFREHWVTFLVVLVYYTLPQIYPNFYPKLT